MQEAVMRGASVTDKKIVSISSKRQITIPQKFFALLGFSDEAECVLRGNELVLRPARMRSGGEFAENILADLLREGYAGDELLARFRERQTALRPAVEAMLADAEKAAAGTVEYASYDDVFGSEE